MASLMRKGSQAAALLALQPDPWPRNHSLFLFGKFHPFRKACKKLAEDKTFDFIMLLLILISALVLIVDVPRTSADSSLGVLIFWTNLALTVAFTLELLIKVRVRMHSCCPM